MRLLTKPHFFVSKATKRNMLNCIIIEDDFAFALDLRIKAEEIGLNVIDMVSHFDEIHGRKIFLLSYSSLVIRMMSSI